MTELITRRGLLIGLGSSLILAPAVVKATSLMPVKALSPELLRVRPTYLELLEAWKNYYYPWGDGTWTNDPDGTLTKAKQVEASKILAQAEKDGALLKIDPTYKLLGYFGPPKGFPEYVATQTATTLASAVRQMTAGEGSAPV